MKFFEAKDTVREHFSRLGFPSSQLIISLSQGRRFIEKYANFWWMRKEKDFNLVVDQATYSITTSGGGGLNLPKFKDARALIWKELAASTRFEPVLVGKNNKEELDVFYGTGDKGSPEEAFIEDTTLHIYPPKPQITYVMRLYHFEWTDNPENTLDDDLLNFFPMALVYSSIAWGYEMVLHDLQGAIYWKTLLGGRPFGRGGLLAEMRRENFKRGQQEQISFEPRLGPGRLQRRRLDNLQIYR